MVWVSASKKLLRGVRRTPCPATRNVFARCVDNLLYILVVVSLHMRHSSAAGRLARRRCSASTRRSQSCTRRTSPQQQRRQGEGTGEACKRQGLLSVAAFDEFRCMLRSSLTPLQGVRPSVDGGMAAVSLPLWVTKSACGWDCCAFEATDFKFYPAPVAGWCWCCRIADVEEF